nr:hypothetical protein [Tanacetum cinerariifolium]
AKEDSIHRGEPMFYNLGPTHISNVFWKAKPGVETIDASTCLKLNMRAMVLWTINDFPARSSLYGWSGQGYKACPTCNEDTPSVRVLGKTTYVGHRRFLKKPHKWRRSLEFNGETENGDPPREFSRDAIMTKLARLPTRVKGKHPSYIPPNNKQNKPTQGDIGATSNEPTQAKHNEFEELYASANQELYPGCDYVTRLDFMAKFTYFKAKGYKLPSSYYAIKKTFKTIELGWKDNNRPGKKVPKKVLRYFPIIPRLQRLYKSSHTAKKITWHATEKRTEPGKMQHPVDGRAWKNFDTKHSNFAKKSRNALKGVETIDVATGQKFNIRAMQYLPDEVAKPIIELCLFFKQICSATLMEDDMLKAQSKVVDILCNLELIYPPAFFDIMIHLVIHLPLEALEGGPIRPRWMFPFERFMKKLKGYVQNKAKPKGSIAEGYVAEEALTFSSHYFGDVTTKFNHPDHNVDPPPPTCQFQVFRSLCKLIGLRKFPNKDMKEEIPDWFGSQICQRHVDNDPGVSATSELFALACGPTPTPISVNSCVVNGVRFVVHSHDERHTTQNSGICLPGGKDREMYYGQLQEILEFSYLSFKVVLFRVKWLTHRHIIDLDEDGDIIDDEDALPHDLADYDDKDLVNVDNDDGVDVVYSNVARGHAGESGGDDRPPTYYIPTGCGGCFVNRGKDTRKPNLGGRKAGRLHTCQETRNLGLKKITDDKVPTQFDLKPHMQSQRWTYINAGIQRHSQKFYNTNTASLKAAHWVINPETETYDVESIRQRRPEKFTLMESSATREYMSLIHTFFVTHTVGGVFMRDEDRAIYEEMLRLQGLGTNTPSGVPYTEKETNALARKGKQRGHLPGVGRVLPGRVIDVLSPPPPQCTHNSTDVEKLKKKIMHLTKHVILMMKLFRSDDKFSQMLNQYESSPEFGNASGSGGCRDDELAGEDEEDERMAIVRDVIYGKLASSISSVFMLINGYGLSIEHADSRVISPSRNARSVHVIHGLVDQFNYLGPDSRFSSVSIEHCLRKLVKSL